MTRENAKKQLIHILAFLNPQLSGADIKALNMAIDVLEQEPSVSAETWGEISGAWTVRFAPNEPNKSEIPTSCDDAISREAFITRYREWMKSEYGKIPDDDTLAIRVIKSLPSVQPSKCEECGAKAREISKYSYEYGKHDVIEDIKAEIQEHTQRYTLARESGGMGQVDWSDYLIKADDVIKIIDKHTSGDMRGDTDADSN